MKRSAISLKSRVRYEGKVQTFDRRAKLGADLEKIPNPIWFTVGQVIRSNFRKPILAAKFGKSVFKGPSI
jgi:hypothetical protein